MANVFFIVEDSTEELFYKKQLQAQYISSSGEYKHYFHVVQMPSKKNEYRRINKGGHVTFQVCVNNVKRFIQQNSHCKLILLILDYYGLHASFLDHIDNQSLPLSKKIEVIQNRLESEISHPLFKFRLQVHEFEAYLFSSPSILEVYFQKPGLKSRIEKILKQFDQDPEKINNDPTTAPSKRLKTLIPDFGKTTDGLSIAEKIGVLEIRNKCERFNQLCKLIDDLLQR